MHGNPKETLRSYFTRIYFSTPPETSGKAGHTKAEVTQMALFTKRQRQYSHKEHHDQSLHPRIPLGSDKPFPHEPAHLLEVQHQKERQEQFWVTSTMSVL